jgi:dGTPase
LGIICLSAPGEPLRYARHPLAYLMEAADDICYEIMDIEDSHKLKILTYDETADLLLGFFEDDEKAEIRLRLEEEQVTDRNEQVVYMRASAVGKLESECVQAFVAHEEEILNGTFKGSLIDNISPLQRDAYKRCAKVSYQKIYRSKPVLDVELSGYKIMETLMQTLIGAAIHPEKYHSQQLIGRFSSQYDIQSPDLETRIQAVLDYISGMTDVYALDVYQKINGISLPII